VCWTVEGVDGRLRLLLHGRGAGAATGLGTEWPALRLGDEEASWSFTGEYFSSSSGSSVGNATKRWAARDCLGASGRVGVGAAIEAAESAVREDEDLMGYSGCAQGYCYSDGERATSRPGQQSGKTAARRSETERGGEQGLGAFLTSRLQLGPLRPDYKHGSSHLVAVFHSTCRAGISIIEASLARQRITERHFKLPSLGSAT